MALLNLPGCCSTGIQRPHIYFVEGVSVCVSTFQLGGRGKAGEEGGMEGGREGGREERGADYYLH